MAYRGDTAAADEQPKLIVLSMSRRYGADFSFTAYDPAWMTSLTDLVATLRADTGARIPVLGPVPDPHSDVPVCPSAHLDNALTCAPERQKGCTPTASPANPRPPGGRRPVCGTRSCSAPTGCAR